MNNPSINEYIIAYFEIGAVCLLNIFVKLTSIGIRCVALYSMNLGCLCKLNAPERRLAPASASAIPMDSQLMLKRHAIYTNLNQQTLLH